MPATRSRAVAPGTLSASPVQVADSPLVRELGRLVLAGAGHDELDELRHGHPDEFEHAYNGLLDDLARQDIHWFASRCVKDQITSEYLQPRPLDILIQSHIDECARDGKYAGILAPIGCGKTYQVLIVRVLWELCKNPNSLIRFICATDDTAKKRLGFIGQTILRDPDFRRVWGHRVAAATALSRSSAPWNAHELSIVRSSISIEPTLKAAGALTSSVGARCTHLIFDDAIDQRVMFSPAYRQNLHEKIHNEILGRKVLTQHQIIWVCTRWTEDDESGLLMANPRWRFLVVRVSDDFGHLDVEYVEREHVLSTATCPLPTGWTPKMLQAERQSLGALPFERCYRQRAVSETDKTFQHFARCYDDQLSFTMAGERAMRERWPCYVGVDISGPRRPGTAISVIGIDPNEPGRRQWVDARAGRWGSVALAGQLDDVYRRYDVKVVRVENNSVQELFFGIVAADPEKHLWGRLVEPFTTTAKAKWDIETGIMTMDLEFQNQGWVIPARQMTDHDFESAEHYRECAECRALHEVGAHPMFPSTDILMSLWIARSGADAYDPRTTKAIEEALRGMPEDDFYGKHPLQGWE